MQKRSCLFLLISMSICSTVASKEATVYTIYPEEVPIYHRWSGTSIDSLILRLVDAQPGLQQEAISDIKEMNIPDDQLLLRVARLSRLLFDSRVEFYHHLAARAQSSPIFDIIDVDKALDGLLHVIRSANRTVYTRNSQVGRRTDLARRAIEAIAAKLRESEIEPLPGTVPLLAEALGEQDPEIRKIAAELLGCIPAAAKDAVPALFDALRNEDRRVRAEAVFTLGKTAAVNPDVQSEIAEKLVALLSAPSFKIYYGPPHRYSGDFHDQVAQALTSIGPPAVPSLLGALDSTDTEVRYHAAFALAYIDSEHAEKSIPILAEGLASPHLLRRTSAIGELQILAMERPALVPKIIPIFREILRTMGPPPRKDDGDDFEFYSLVSLALEHMSPKK